MSNVLKVNTTETASLLSGIAEGDKACNNRFTSLDEEAELKTTKLPWTTANYKHSDPTCLTCIIAVAFFKGSIYLSYASLYVHVGGTLIQLWCLIKEIW